MPRNAGLGVAEAKKKVIDSIGNGLTRGDAMKLVGRQLKTFENWQADDKNFASAVAEARGRRKRALEAGRDESAAHLGFEDWRSRFLGRVTYDHHRQWVDVLEGREPQALHQSIIYEPARPSRIIINTPPFHSKSTVITQEYVAYRICMNPNIRVLIVSQTREKAKEFLYSIKTMLISNQFAEMHAAYAPEGGFKPPRADGAMWSQDKIYVAGRGGDEAADKAAKDPTVQALGIRGHIYGSRADLIILDDCVTLTNVTEYEKQTKWLNQEVSSRAKNGKIILVGTRVAPLDLYAHLRNGDNFPSGKSPWTYLGQPAVLEYADKPKDWLTLWPRSMQPLDENGEDEADEDGTYSAWDGVALSEVREANMARDWALVYMQQAVSEDAIFHPIAVQGSVDRRRSPGIMRAGEFGGRRDGMEGLHVVGSIDPAGTGEAFMLLYALDRSTGERWVLNAWMATHTNIQWYASMIEQLTQEFNVNEWVVESNGYSNWLIHDERIVDFLRSRGVLMMPHYTSRNKQDPDFGVQTVAPLFGAIRPVDGDRGGRMVHDGNNLIRLPNPDKSEGIKALAEQLVTWQPGKLGKNLRQDGPMALWFAETRAKTFLSPKGGQQNFVSNRFLSRAQQRKRITFSHDRGA